MTTLEQTTGESLTDAGSGSASRLTLLRRAYTAELIKLRSVRSTVWLLGLTALGLIGMGVVNTIGVVVRAAQDPAFDRSTVDPAGGSLSGLGSAWLPMAALGILAVIGDYATGMIKTTIAAVPSRTNLVLGKIGALVSVVLPVTLASTMITSWPPN
jgi:ABC-2 type transport system permease protein